MSYNYDKQIEELTKNPDQIKSDWFKGEGLFKYINPNNYDINNGCLTRIRLKPDFYKAIINGKNNEELVQEIAKDDRIPKYSKDITIESLQVFKEWQEKIDLMQTSESYQNA